MADLRFRARDPRGLVTTVGARVQAFDDEAAGLGLAPEEAERLKRAMGFSTRHVVADPGTTTADLCLHSARHLMRGLDLQPDAVDGLILVTQTPDYSSPSTSIGCSTASACGPTRSASTSASAAAASSTDYRSPTAWSNPASTASCSASATSRAAWSRPGTGRSRRSWAMPAPRC